MHHLKHLSEEMKQCVGACASCQEICLNVASNHCLEKGGEHVAPEHFRLMLDCAEICATEANFMLRNSPGDQPRRMTNAAAILAISGKRNLAISEILLRMGWSRFFSVRPEPEV